MSEKRKLTSSDNLADLHIFVVPSALWLEKYRTAFNNIALESTSAGFVRVQPKTSLAQLRDHIEDQIGFDVIPDEFVYLRSVGRCMAVVNAHQEKSLKVKHFLPPTAYSPEIFLLAGTHDTVFHQSNGDHVVVASEGHTTAGLSSLRHPLEQVSSKQSSRDENNSSVDNRLGERQSSDDSRTSELMKLRYKTADKPFYSDHESDSEYNTTSRGTGKADLYSPLRKQKQSKGQYNSPGDSPRDDKHVQTDFESDSRGDRSPSKNKQSKQKSRHGSEGPHEDKESPKSRNRRDNSERSSHRNSLDKSNDSTPETRKKTIRFLQPEVIPSPQLHGEVHVSPPTPIPTARVIHNTEVSSSSGHDQVNTQDGDRYPIDDTTGSREGRDEGGSRAGSRKKKKGSHEGKKSKLKKERHARADIDDQELHQEQIDRVQREDDLPAEGDSGIVEDDVASIDNGTPKQSQKKKNPLIHSKTSPALFNTPHHKPGSDRDRDIADGDETEHRGDKLGTVGEDEEDGNHMDVGRGLGQEDSKIGSPVKGHQGGDTDKDNDGRESKRRKKKGGKGKGDVDGRDDTKIAEDEVERESGTRKGRKGQSGADDSDGDMSSGSRMGGSGSNKPETDSAKDRKRLQMEKLKEELKARKAERIELEQNREQLVKKAKLLQSQTQTKRTQAKNIWKKKYFDEKKKTSPLEEQCNRLRYEFEGQHKKLMTALEGKEKAAKRGEEPSFKSNQKMLLARLQHEKDDLRRKVEETQMQLANQMKMRDSAQKELKELRDRTLEKKINVTLTKSQRNLQKPDLVV